jgi:hypothetical protein
MCTPTREESWNECVDSWVVDMEKDCVDNLETGVTGCSPLNGPMINKERHHYHCSVPVDSPLILIDDGRAKRDEEMIALILELLPLESTNTPNCICENCKRRRGIESAELPLLCKGPFAELAMIEEEEERTPQQYILLKNPLSFQTSRGEWHIREVRALLHFVRQYTHVKMRLVRSCNDVKYILKHRSIDKCVIKARAWLKMKPQRQQLAARVAYDARVALFEQYLVDTKDYIRSDKKFDFNQFKTIAGPPLNCFGYA